MTTITAIEPQRPSLEMVRQLTDRRVFEQLLEADSLTRTEIAARTGISKPTISESVRRLIDAALVEETGRQIGGRGRAGTYCRLRVDTTAALAVSVGPDGVIVDTFDLKGVSVAHVEHAVPTPVDGSELQSVLQHAVRAAVDQTGGDIRSCVVSVAGPVDQRTGRLIAQPHSPFIVGEFDPRTTLDWLRPMVDVDNDVNWAALAEHRHGNATDLESFVLCYLGAGIGGAVMVAGTIVAGRRGMAGELAQVRTTGPGGGSLTLFECFAAWDLLKPGSDAIDVVSLRSVLAGQSPADRRLRDQIAGAIAGAVSSVIATLDPQGILIGGPWGSFPGLLDLVAERIDPLAATELIIRPTAVTEAPYRDGIKIRALATARQAVANAF